MKNNLFNQLLSFPSLSILLGVIGFLSGITQLFIDINTTISIKWMLFLIMIFLSVTLILIKLIFDLSKSKNRPAFEKPISCVQSDNNDITFLIRENENFKYNIFVAGYVKRNQLDTLSFIGYVENVQEKMLHIHVSGWTEKPDLHDRQGNIKQEILSSIEIRPVLPRQALELLTNKTGDY